jgi:hypothetical protein
MVAGTAEADPVRLDLTTDRLEVDPEQRKVVPANHKVDPVKLNSYPVPRHADSAPAKEGWVRPRVMALHKWALWDSNPGPTDYESAALTD